MIMELERCEKESFSVIGKEGSTNDGASFIRSLWEQANGHFDEVAAFAKRDERGNILGIWGLMSDFSRGFRPWEDGFSEGLYLAGVEALDDAQAPTGWVKWTVPSYEYLYVRNDGPNTFARVIKYFADNNITLIGAAHDFNCPESGLTYLFFPVRKL